MCKFMSAIVVKKTDGIEIICHPEHTDSHDDLIKFAQLRETDVAERSYCKIEYVPQGKVWEIDNYKLEVDEARDPGWWADKKDEVKERLDAILKVALIDRPFHLGGLHICNGTTCIVKGSRVFAENSTVEALGNSTVEAWGNSTVKAWGNSTVKAWENSTVEALGNSTVTKCNCGSCSPTIIDTRKKEASA
jgi:hypothetical protein